ncbi:baseplate J/gp47 family protein [Paenibacillus humicus]|uniref:baseplate J/gp47 family protein n=1 Tax=Paenibacillus humicus TaxID=412861 RepID=UPI000FD823F8|nr:baseplate J/gp47 family protein [Paenibacillus humicus]
MATDFDSILSRMLSNVLGGVAKGEGTFTFDALAPVALEVSQAYDEIERIKRVRAGSSEDATEEEVDMIAAEQGVTRKPAVKSEGTVQLYGPSGTKIPTGSFATTESGTVFDIQGAATEIPVSGTVSLKILAQVAGASGNVPAGSISKSSIPGVTVTNLEETRGGTDLESKEALLARAIEKRDQPAVSGNPDQYKQTAKTVPGIFDARVFRGWAGGGTVKVVLISVDKRTPGASAVAAADALIQAMATTGSVPTVVGVSELLVDVSAKLILVDGGSLDEARVQVQEAITAYLKALAFTETVVKLNRIGEAILSAGNVSDYEYGSLTINGSTGNLQLQQDQVPVMGALNLTI